MTNSLLLDTQRPWDLVTQCPAYSPTPIQAATAPSRQRILIKDETHRFNLGAFKALGGIYAIAAFLLDRWQSEKAAALPPEKLFEKELQAWSKQFTFVCASAGNHGIAVAKGAQLFNARCRVYLAGSVPASFANRLCNLNAEVVRSGETYEDSMKAAREDCARSAQDHAGKILLADSSWPGYTELPGLVMEGYTVLAEEMRQQFLAADDWPSHVFLQAGVGGLAAATAYHIRQHWPRQPQIIVVEPEAAPCLFESNRLGELTTVEGPQSVMGRLDCKEASLIAFEGLQKTADLFVCISESDAASAVAFLAGEGIQTTPSGAAGMAAVLAAEKLAVPVTEHSTCLVIATEGPE